MVTSPNYIVSIPITFPCPCIFVIKLNMFKDCFFASMYCPSWLWIGFPKDANNHIWLKGEQEVLQEKIRIFSENGIQFLCREYFWNWLTSHDSKNAPDTTTVSIFVHPSLRYSIFLLEYLLSEHTFLVPRGWTASPWQLAGSTNLLPCWGIEEDIRRKTLLWDARQQPINKI